MDADHRGLEYLGVAHDRVLELDARDPLAAAFDHVLRAVLDLDVPLGVDGGDVAGPEPAVVERLRASRVIVVFADDPRTANLDLPHRLAVPRARSARVIDDAKLRARCREPLLGEQPQ